MDKQSAWSRFSRFYRYYGQVGMALDISTMSMSEQWLESEEPRAKEALREMAELEKGAIANPDEGRQVGHYWLRKPTLAPVSDLAKEISDALERLKSFANKVKKGQITNSLGSPFRKVVVLGIGGSALGPQLVYDAFGVCGEGLRLYFSDNTDPDGMGRLWKQIEPELSQVLFIVISKSGSTVETRNGMLEAQKFCQENGLSFSERAVAITCVGSKLDKLAISEEWLERFPLWDWVGGRTSLFSPVGMLPAALQGVDIDELIAGAADMDEITRCSIVEDNPATLLALSWFSSGRGRGDKDMVIIPYKDRLLLFSRYMQQLVMESLGKALNRRGVQVNQGLSVYGNKGSTDQHAYVQQLRDGTDNFFVTFIDVLADGELASGMEVEPGITSGDYLNGFYLGTREAVADSGKESLSISLDSFTPRSLGALLALFERAVGIYASMIDINAYHQPGVEAGKVAAGQVIALQRKIIGLMSLPDNEGKSWTAMEISAALGGDIDTVWVYKLLIRLANNTASGISCGSSRNPWEARFSRSSV